MNKNNMNDPQPIIADAVPISNTATATVTATNQQPIVGVTVDSNLLPETLNEGAAYELLQQSQFPLGLQHAFVENLSRVPIRFFILDDSGSMTINDGNRLQDAGDKKVMIKCSRWDELAQSMKFHAKFAHDALAPTEFRFLNSSNPIKVGFNDSLEHDRYNTLLGILNGYPGGGTPLCRHIREIIEEIKKYESLLRSSGKKACIVIATDGQSSDGDVAQAMKPLKDLPVWVVVRLCTDQDDVVDYWNNIDAELELNMDVLDDLAGEAKEVYDVNPCITYGEQLHRIREFGIVIKDFDLLDEAKFSKDQLRRICMLIFGGKLEDYPHPEADWNGFEKFIIQRNSILPKPYDTVKRKYRDWIDVKAMNHSYHNKGCTIS